MNIMSNLHLYHASIYLDIMSVVNLVFYKGKVEFILTIYDGSFSYYIIIYNI